MKQKPPHRFALPSWLSRSGHKPAVSARLLFVVVVPIFIALSLNAVASAWVEGTIYPGVAVAGKDLSGMTRRQAYGALQSMPLSRRYRITVGDKVFEATNDQIGAAYDLNATVDLAYSVGRESNIALLGLWQAPREGQLEFAYRLDYGQLQKFTTNIVSSVGKPPKNAGIVVREGVVVAVPDEGGLQVDQRKMTSLISETFGSATDQAFELEPEPVDAPIAIEQTVPAQQKTQAYLQRRLTFQYGQKQFIPSPVDIGYWVVVEPDQEINPKNLVVKISEQEVRGYVQAVANQINKNPVNKREVVANGQATVEREGKEGLAVDQEDTVRQTLAAMSSGQDSVIAIKTNPIPFKTEAPKTTVLNNSKYIEVNLSTQRLYAYENGQLIYTTPITSGASALGRGTVTGMYAIYYKTRNTYLNGAAYGWNYNSFVQYWMPFYQGYGLHDASWRSVYGTQSYPTDGSHGCVNLPTAAATFIYNWSSVGTTVWVHV